MSAILNSCYALVVISDKDNRARNLVIIGIFHISHFRIRSHESWTRRFGGSRRGVRVKLIKANFHELR
jgi:hypothetical protein